MRSPGQIWRDRVWVWVPALIFFVANLVLLSTYRLRYAGQVQSLDDRLHEQESQAKDLEKKRNERQGMLNQLQMNDAAVRQLYEQRFSTRRQRLVAATREVWEMATKAGLDPKSISYPEEEIQDFDLIKRSFVFSVSGTYQNLRRFVQQLEASPSFLTLEAISIGGDSDGPELRMDLTISTLFTKDPAAPPAPVAEAVRSGAPGGGTRP